MINIGVKLDKIVIADHHRGEVLIETHFSEGEHRGILRQKSRLNNIEALSDEIVKEIRKEIKKNNAAPIGDNILDATVNVRFQGDEDELLKKMRFFFSKIQTCIKSIGMNGTPMKYLNAVNDLKGMELKFN